MVQYLIKSTSFVIGGSTSIVMKQQPLLNQETPRSKLNDYWPAKTNKESHSQPIDDKQTP